MSLRVSSMLFRLTQQNLLVTAWMDVPSWGNCTTRATWLGCRYCLMLLFHNHWASSIITLYHTVSYCILSYHAVLYCKVMGCKNVSFHMSQWAAWIQFLKYTSGVSLWSNKLVESISFPIKLFRHFKSHIVYKYVYLLALFFFLLLSFFLFFTIVKWVTCICIQTKLVKLSA